MTARVMIVDDEQAIRESLQGLFEDEGYAVECAASGEEAVVRFRKRPADCLLLDIWMPGIDGLEALSRIKKIDAAVPVIMMSGHATIDTAVRATRKGAFDFVEKPLSSDKLLVLVRNALEKQKLSKENLSLRQDASQQISRELVGESAAIKEVRALIKRVAVTNAPVMLTGEHGSGKSTAAHLLYAQSKRVKSPYIEVKMAGMPESRVDPELFGYEKGAFAGALTAQAGKFESAHGGTIFLDEIELLNTGTQARLLRMLQERAIQRIGGKNTSPADVRLLTATSGDPEQLVREGCLREDFYCRLNVGSIHMPALRDRTEDIPMIAQAIAVEQAKLLGGEAVTFSESAMDELVAYSWPGNIRELRNYVERSHILAKGGRTIDHDLLSLDKSAAALDAESFDHGFHHAREAFERNYLLHHLKVHDWNISRTAQGIGMERSQLHRKIKSYDLVPGKG
ncbi:MAG: sigma-54 dependent transcriptional regulator [Mariprofundaceae bacterium]